jgi:hypothetical protein
MNILFGLVTNLSSRGNPSVCQWGGIRFASRPEHRLFWRGYSCIHSLPQSESYKNASKQVAVASYPNNLLFIVNKLNLIAIGTLYWTLPIVWGISDIHDVSGVGPTPVFRWLVVMMLTLFSIVSDNARNKNPWPLECQASTPVVKWLAYWPSIRKIPGSIQTVVNNNRKKCQYHDN